MEFIKKIISWAALVIIAFYIYFYGGDNLGSISTVKIISISLMLLLQAFFIKITFFEGLNLKFKVRSLDDVKSNDNRVKFMILFFITFFISFSTEKLTQPQAYLFLLLIAISVLLSLSLILREYSKNQKFTPSIIGFSIFIALMLHFSKSAYQTFFGDEEIGSFLEKSTYETKYYVNLFNDRNSSKNYRLPATLEVYDEYVEPYDDEGSGHSIRRIKLKKIFFPNGGYLSFSDCDDCFLKAGKKESVTADNGSFRYVELTNTKYVVD